MYMKDTMAKIVNFPLLALCLLIQFDLYSSQFTCPSVCKCPTSKIVNCNNFNSFKELDFTNSMLLNCDLLTLSPMNNKVNIVF